MRSGRLHAGFFADGNLTTSPWTAPQTNAVNAFAVHGVQSISPALGATVVGIGDSIMTSSCTAGQSSGFGIRACAIVSTPQLPVSCVNQGYPGRSSSGFCSCATCVIQHLKPQAALIQTWSGNEPWTREMADLSFARAMAVADTARRNRCVPILVTLLRCSGPTPKPRRTGNTSAFGLVPRRNPGAICWTSTRFGAPVQRPTPIGANMIGAIRCTRTTPLAPPPPVCSSDAAADPRRLQRPATQPWLAAVRVAQSS